VIPRSEWLQNPYTKQLRKEVERVIQEIKDEWGEGHFISPERNAYARGRIHGLSEIFNMETDDEE